MLDAIIFAKAVLEEVHVMRIYILIVTVLSVSCLAWSESETAGDEQLQLKSYPLAFGTVTMAGGKKCVEFSTAPVPFTIHPNMMGKLKNGVDGFLVHDVEIEVIATKPTTGNPNPPTIIGATINGVNFGGGNTASSLSCDLGQKPIQDQGRVNAAVDLAPAASNAATSFKICFTPSLKLADQHYDGLGMASLNLTTASSTAGLASGHNPGVFRLIVNSDDSESLTSMTGVVTFAPEDTSTDIVSISLVDSADGSAVAGTSVTITGNSFAMTGFTGLAPEASYGLFILFDQTPIGSVSSEVTASFD